VATVLDKIETELVTLMGDKGRDTLQSCLRKTQGRSGDMAFFNKIALVQELSKTFSMIMPEDRILRFKLKLLNLKGDDEV